MIAFVGKAAAAGFIGLVLLAIFWAISAVFWGWVLMLALGIAHIHGGWPATDFGYGTCFLLGFPLSLVLG